MLIFASWWSWLHGRTVHNLINFISFHKRHIFVFIPLCGSSVLLHWVDPCGSLAVAAAQVVGVAVVLYSHPNLNSQQVTPHYPMLCLMLRDPQGYTKIHRDPQGYTEIHRDPQGSSKIQEDPQESTRVHRDPQRFTRINFGL